MLNIITFNVNGLASSEAGVPKRRKLFTWLKTHHCDVALLQETHCTDSMQCILTQEWGGDSYFCNGTSDSRGVCILIKRGLDMEVKEVRRDDQGRLIFVKAVFEGKLVLIGNIYCPNIDEVETMMRVNEWLSEMQVDNVIIAGDFNITLDPVRDREWPNQRTVRDYCRRRSKAVRETLEEFQLVDVWRKQNPDASQYTFSRGTSRSRLDYFFISEHLCSPGVKVTCVIMSPFLADHRAVQLKVCPVRQARGPGYWKFNNSLLSDENFVQELSTFISQALDDNDKPGVSKVLLFETILCMARGKIIQYASRKKRMENERLQRLESIISAQTNANVIDEQLQKAQEERNKIIEARTKANMFRCKVNWAAYAEKSSAYFFALEQRRVNSRSIPALFLNHVEDTGPLSDNTEKMLNECSAFYGTLYKRDSISSTDFDSFLDSTEKITDAQREECDLQLTAAELTAALSSLKSNTAPGPCGWTAEFFKTFWDMLCPLFLKLTNEIYERGAFPESFSRSVLTLIPKKGKDKRHVENLRPISLLPVPYKIIAKAMAARLKKVVGDLIHTDQTGFLKGRYIGENVRLIMDLMEFTEQNQIKGMLMQCDFQKAYDSISWEFLNEAIKSYGFGPKFRKWMSVFYPSGSHSSRVNVNNFLSPPFQIERGIRQGCPLSCLIWLLCMEPLLRRIRSTEDIRGVKISETEMKVSAYADDLTVVLDGTEGSLRSTMIVLNEFRAVTGLHLNLEKTICTWIGSAGRDSSPLCQELSLRWLKEEETLDLLGVKIANDPQRTREINFDHKIEEMENAMSPWLQRSLTPLGRVILVKSLFLAKFVHLFSVLENPDTKYMARLESLIFKFIWGKKDKVKRGVAKKQFLEGGIGAPDVESFANALKVSWIRRWLEPKQASWKVFVNEKFKVSSRLNIFQCVIGKPQVRNRRLPCFWDQALTAWAQIMQSSCEIDDHLTQPLYLNRNLDIESQLSASQLRTMNELNITYVRDLYNFSARRWLTAKEVKQKWNCLSIMTCNFLVSKLSSTWRQVKTCNKPCLDSAQGLNVLLPTENTTKWAYKKLVEPKLILTCTCESKWNAELGAVPNWSRLIGHLTESTKNIELRWLQFRILHRIIPTRKLLNLYRITENDQCVFCNRATETVSHLFVHCPKVKAFWNEVWRVFNRCNEKYKNTELSARLILLGVDLEKKHDLNLFLLLAKLFIWKQSKKESVLSIRLFLIHLESFRSVQSRVYSMNGKSKEFGALWSATANAINALKN